MNSEVLSESFGEEYPLLVDIINSLLVDVSGWIVLLLLCKYVYTCRYSGRALLKITPGGKSSLKPERMAKPIQSCRLSVLSTQGVAPLVPFAAPLYAPRSCVCPAVLHICCLRITCAKTGRAM